jgi:hypothetical protein
MNIHFRAFFSIFIFSFLIFLFHSDLNISLLATSVIKGENRDTLRRFKGSDKQQETFDVLERVPVHLENDVAGLETDLAEWPLGIDPGNHNPLGRLYVELPGLIDRDKPHIRSQLILDRRHQTPA